VIARTVVCWVQIALCQDVTYQKIAHEHLNDTAGVAYVLLVANNLYFA
jgi:hypothetical protein